MILFLIKFSFIYFFLNNFFLSFIDFLYFFGIFINGKTSIFLIGVFFRSMIESRMSKTCLDAFPILG